MNAEYADIHAAFDGSNKRALTPEQERAKKLETVRALLSKADGAGSPEEADAFRAKADHVMTAFAISQWMIEEAQAGVYNKPKPEVRWFDFGWWYTTEHNHRLYEMFCSVASHCRCVIATRGRGKDPDRNYRRMPVIGLASDLDWFDLLFTNLMLQMARQLEPKPDPLKSFEENAYVMRLSGMAKPRIGRLMWEAKIPAPGFDVALFDEPFSERKDHNGRMADREMGKYVRACRTGAERWAADNDLDSSVVGTGTTGTVVWARSFARGYVRRISDRLWEMRCAEERPSSDGPSVSIALRDIRQVAVELYEETWPDMCHGCGNHVTACTCKCSKCGKLYADCECPVKVSRAMSRTVVVDRRGIAAGGRAADKADLSGSPSRRVGGRKQLGS
jgi:hypothetical protein